MQNYSQIYSDYASENLDQIINEEYKIWKMNVPFFYDYLTQQELISPATSVQWLPIKDKLKESDFSMHKMILGLHSLDNEYSSLAIANVKIPIDETIVDLSEYSTNCKDGKGMGLATGENKIDIECQIFQEDDITIARYMPQKSTIIAVKYLNSSFVNIYDYSLFTGISNKNNLYQPQLKLKGHSLKKNNMLANTGLSWNEVNEGLLLSAGINDQKILCWDISNSTQMEKDLTYSFEILWHKGPVHDVSWNKLTPDVFGSVSEDRYFCLWDKRKNMKNPSIFISGNEELLTLDFNPFNENLVLTAGSSNSINLWDLRNPSKNLHVFYGHLKDVQKVQFSNFNSGIFASGSSDRRIIVWDIAKIGTKQKLEEEIDGPPEMLVLK